MVLYLRRNLIILVHFKRAANDALDQPLFSQNSNVFGMFEGKKKKKTLLNKARKSPNVLLESVTFLTRNSSSSSRP